MRAYVLVVKDPAKGKETYDSLVAIGSTFHVMGYFDNVVVIDEISMEAVYSAIATLRHKNHEGILDLSILVAPASKDESPTDTVILHNEDAIRAFLLLSVGPDHVNVVLEELHGSSSVERAEEVEDTSIRPLSVNLVVIIKVNSLDQIPMTIRSIRDISGVRSAISCITFPGAPEFSSV